MRIQHVGCCRRRTNQVGSAEPCMALFTCTRDLDIHYNSTSVHDERQGAGNEKRDKAVYDLELVFFWALLTFTMEFWV